MHARQVAQILTDAPHNKALEEAYSVGRFIFQKMGFKEKNERLTVMLLLGGDEITRIAEAADAILPSVPPSNPRPVTAEDLRALLRAAWSGADPVHAFE